MIKGSNHHVLPDSSGWCVISEANQKVVAHFETREKAINYASQCAHSSEGCVLVHSTPLSQAQELSTVALPQQENLPDMAYLNVPDGLLMVQTELNIPERVSGFDPLLGFDEYYFEL